MGYKDIAKALFDELEDGRISDFEGSAVNKKELVAIIAAALRQREKETWEKAARVCEDFDCQSWDDIEGKYLVTLDALHPDLGKNIAIVLRQQAEEITP